MNPTDINCKMCGCVFSARDPRKMYCSPECNGAAQYAKQDHSQRQRLKAQRCAQCDTEFKPYSKRNKFCSEPCKNNWNNQHRAYTGVCVGCSSPFTCSNPRQRYCGRPCQLKHTIPTKTLVCVDCGTPFEFKGRTRKHRCAACHAKYWGAYLKAYSDDYVGPYRRALLEKETSLRYAFRLRCYTYYPKQCVVCGHDAAARKGYIDVHHIDGDPTNDTPTNLVPLCKRHHKQVHKKDGRALEDKLFELWPSGQKVIGIVAQQWADEITANSGNATS